MSYEPSRTAIDDAGFLVRDWWLGPDPDVSGEVLEAGRLLFDYRRTFRVPLQKTTVGVRQFVQRESSQVLVAQRLKRIPTILDKLSRLPKMRVTRMEDIGGCRAILPGGRAEMGGVLHRMEKNRWEVKRFRDYIAEPKETGYRAIHVVVARDGRPIEIQLRTPNQHGWAALAERVGGMLGHGLKDGVGPEDLLQFFRVLGVGLAFRDEGIEPDRAHKEEFVRLSAQIRERYPEVFAVR